MADDTLVLERIAVLTDQVKSVASGQEELRKAIESGTDGLQVRVRLLEQHAAQEKEERQRVSDQQAAMRVQLLGVVVTVVLTALATGMGYLL